MTGFAQGSGNNMCCRFSACIDAIMALDAVRRDTGVIENGANKARGVMARTALGRRHNVIDGLAACSHAVMTARTRSHYLGVIDGEGRPPTRPMAAFADIR